MNLLPLQLLYEQHEQIQQENLKQNSILLHMHIQADLVEDGLQGSVISLKTVISRPKYRQLHKEEQNSRKLREKEQSSYYSQKMTLVFAQDGILRFSFVVFVHIILMSGQRQTSIRFFVQMMMNIFLCKKAQQLIAKQTLKSDKVGIRSLSYFILFATVLFAINQGAFFYFKDANLYEQLGVRRSMSIAELKEWGSYHLAELRRSRVEQGVSLNEAIKQLEEKLNVLTHPARRLSYDSFGLDDVKYAWSFKYPTFLLQTIIGSAVFFVICTFMSLMNRKKAELKQAFKLQIFAMILLFIWEVDLIITTESRFHHTQTDLVDYIYSAFPIFERREFLKAIIIPCMSLVDTFVRFYLVSPAETKLLLFGSSAPLRNETNKVRQHFANIQMNEHTEEQIGVAVEKAKLTHPRQTEIFRLQRELLKRVLFVEGEEIIARPQVNHILKYFLLK